MNLSNLCLLALFGTAFFAVAAVGIAQSRKIPHGVLDFLYRSRLTHCQKEILHITGLLLQLVYCTTVPNMAIDVLWLFFCFYDVLISNYVHNHIIRAYLSPLLV